MIPIFNYINKYRKWIVLIIREMIEYKVKENSSLELHLNRYTSYKRPHNILSQRWLYTDCGKYCLDEKCSNSSFSLVPRSHLSRDEYRLIVDLREITIETDDFIRENVSSKYYKQYTIPFQHKQYTYIIECYSIKKYTLCKYCDTHENKVNYIIYTNETFTPDFKSLYT
jgi:hypothetical protein